MTSSTTGLAQNIGKTDHNSQKYLKNANFHKFGHSSMATTVIKKNNKKIEQATKNDSLIISYNFNISDAMTCPKS